MALTDKEISGLMHALVDMHKAAEKIQTFMKEKNWMDADSPDEIEDEDEFERDVFRWVDSTAYPGHELLSCQDIAARLFRELKARGARDRIA